MAFDLARIRKEIEAAPLLVPWPSDLAVAVVSDTFRMAGVAPPSDADWIERSKPSWFERLGVLAWLLASTSLREETVRALKPGFDALAAVAAFLDAVAPLTAEMLRQNAFRQEELIRQWIAAVGGRIAGETAAQSRKKLEQLDYRKTLVEYERAEKARKEEAEKRAQALREAAEREAQERGWRE